jgi:hypothetical protein
MIDINERITEFDKCSYDEKRKIIINLLKNLKAY